MRAGRTISEHRAPGEIIIQCPEDKGAFTAADVTRELAAGQLMYLNASEPHSVNCLEDASFLLTLELGK